MSGVGLELGEGGEFGVEAESGRADDEFRIKVGAGGEQALHEGAHGILGGCHAEEDLGGAGEFLVQPARKACFRFFVHALERFEQGQTGYWNRDGSTLVQGKPGSDDPLPEREPSAERREQAKDGGEDHGVSRSGCLVWDDTAAGIRARAPLLANPAFRGSSGEACKSAQAVCAPRVQRLPAWLEKTELTTLFFLHGTALGMWFVPLSRVLDAHGYQEIKPLAFATSALAAFVSPLVFGAMADRHASPVRVLRWLAVATAAAMAVASFSIRARWPAWAVLGLIQLHALCSSPTWSISNTIVFSRLQDSRRQFGPIRAMATLGWMAGCWIVSWMAADASTLSGFSGAVAWLVVAGFTLLLPEVDGPVSTGKVPLRERLGLDALLLLKNPDHRVVYLTTAFFAIPLAAFYPYTPPQLRELGLERTSAWMTLGQITEVLSMFALGGLLLRWRLKWIFGVGLGFGVLRYALCAMDGRPWLLAGVTLHGCSFTLVYITAQIYLDERVDPAWRARGQALMSLTSSGFGNLLGYLGTGWWFHACTAGGSTRWTLFWAVLSGSVGLVLFYFLVAYHGRGTSPGRDGTRVTATSGSARSGKSDI